MLTFDDFKRFGFKLDEERFNELLPYATDQISLVTRRYYTFHGFESDSDFRKIAYLKAIAYQIIYMDKQGVLTADDVANKPSSVSQSIGGTSVSTSFGSSRLSGDSSNENKTVVSLESLNQLSGTGLLYRGVRYVDNRYR